MVILSAGPPDGPPVGSIAYDTRSTIWNVGRIGLSVFPIAVRRDLVFDRMQIKDNLSRLGKLGRIVHITLR